MAVYPKIVQILIGKLLLLKILWQAISLSGKNIPAAMRAHLRGSITTNFCY